MSNSFQEPSQQPSDPTQEALRELETLRAWTGASKDFWPRYAEALGKLSFAARVNLLVSEGKEPAQWRRIVEWTGKGGVTHAAQAFQARLSELANRAMQDGECLEALEGSGDGGSHHYALALPVKISGGEQQCVAAVLLSHTNRDAAQETLFRVRLASGIPEIFQLNAANRKAKVDVEKFANVLDIITCVQGESRFVAAALAFCNELATRYRCDRVSLGWLHHGYIRLQAISRMEHFDRQMAAAQALEAAMEEAFDQDDEVLYPAVKGTSLITRDHEQFAKQESVENLCSMPVRVAGEPVAVVTFERNEGAWRDAELQQLRLACDLVARPLSETRESDRWFGARWTSASRKKLAKLVGPEHTWAKLLALTITVLLALLIFLRVDYRVEADSIVRSEEVSFLTAPFEGYIRDVLVEPGEVVEAGEPLVGLDTEELELRKASAIADLTQYRRQSEKARADGALAQMRIAQAQAEQAGSRLDLVRYRLDQATLRAPFDGVVVESDLREKIGAPVKQGESLIRLARIDRLYLEAEVHERDIHELEGDESGQMAFVTQPQQKFPIQVERIEPAAVAKAQKNLFIVRCSFGESPKAWWRPGMSGVCKLKVGKRTLLWIVTHRTVDFVRMKLWW